MKCQVIESGLHPVITETFSPKVSSHWTLPGGIRTVGVVSDMVSNRLRPLVIGWSKYRLGLPQSQWIVS